ncbi:MAG TPA: hypothetical protein VMG74_00375 [Gaiellaceae bacterium]|nr:hypothetical protein [Gaiellaceae bacterium]
MPSNGTAAATAKPRIRLLAPAAGARVPKAAHSPLFRWRVSGEPKRTVYIIQLSSDPHFRAAAIAETKLCTHAGCWTSYRWTSPRWWRESDACYYTPPHGHCKHGQSASGRFYWRVGVSTGRRIVYSPARMFRTPIRKQLPPAAKPPPHTTTSTPGSPSTLPPATQHASRDWLWPLVAACAAALLVASGALLLARRRRPTKRKQPRD